jgi:hypothetical protein
MKMKINIESALAQIALMLGAVKIDFIFSHGQYSHVKYTKIKDFSAFGVGWKVECGEGYFYVSYQSANGNIKYDLTAVPLWENGQVAGIL